LVQGSIRKGGQRVRITAQLIDAKKDRQLWSEKWDRSLEDIFDVQDEVAAAIAAQVNPALHDYEVERIERARPTNLNAWELYLKALHTFHERNQTDHKDPDLELARELSEKSISLDQSLSVAHSLMSEICIAELLQHTAENSTQTVEDILAHGRRAAELDSKNPRASDSISRHYFFSGNFEQAKQYAQRAVKLNPSYPEAHNSLGQALVHSGFYSDAEPHFNKAIELNPLDTKAIIYKDGLFFAHMGLGNFEMAYSLIQECVAQFSDAGFYKGFRASVLGYLNKRDEAKLALEEYLALRPNLKKKSDYKKIFVPNSNLADILIEGLVKAGWEPEAE
jgi:adenylate cyclase